MASHDNLAPREDSDVIRILNLFLRHYKVYIITILVSIFLAFIITRFSQPVYRIAASLLILEDRGSLSGDAGEYLNNEMFGMNQGFQNELYILQSTPVIQQTAENLDLTVNYYTKHGFQWIDSYNSMPFRVMPLKEHVQPVNVQFLVSIKNDKHYTIKVLETDAIFSNLYRSQGQVHKENWSIEFAGRFGKLVEFEDFAFILEFFDGVNYTADENIYCFYFSTIGSVTAYFKSNLTFNVLDREASIIDISLNSPSIQKGIDVVNELMDVYSTQNVNRKNHNAEVTIAYIEKQLGEISDSLSMAEDNLQQFRSSRELLDVTDQAAGMTEQYMDLQNQMAEILTRKRYYDYLAEYVKENDDFTNMTSPSGMGVQDEMLNNLVNQLIMAQTQRSNLIRNKQEKNPLVQRLGIQIENTKQSITENITAIQKTTDISIDELNKRINRVRAEISRLPRTQRQLGGIERTYRLSDAIYNYLLEKRAEAKISQASNLPDNIIVEPAHSQGIVFPNSRKNYVFAFALGIIIPFIFFFLKSFFADKIEYQQNIGHLTDKPIIGKIPHTKRKTKNVVYEYPLSGIAEAYRALRTNIEFRFKEVPHKIILVTSCIEGEGKSFTALNLAMSYALLGRKTILLDLDLRKPTGYFTDNLVSDIGLSSYLTEGNDLSEIILQSEHSNLHYIPSGPIPPNPVELMASDRIKDLVNMLIDSYDCVIIDSTPLAQVADAYLLLDLAKIKILVARYNYSFRRVFHQVMTDLNDKKIENVCVVMNDNRIAADQYGYGYGYENKKEKNIKKKKVKDKTSKVS